MIDEDLAIQECVPCKKGTPPMNSGELARFSGRIGNGWSVVAEHHLEREFKFPNFAAALAFTNKIGELAETVGHHPDFELGWGRVKLTLFTHSINGLSEGDFIFAAKVNRLAPASSSTGS